jgi:hypothetical protein
MNQGIRNKILFGFILVTDDPTTESSEIDLGSPTRRYNAKRYQSHASEKQTLKIEEVFTSSTRHSGQIVLHDNLFSHYKSSQLNL